MDYNEDEQYRRAGDPGIYGGQLDRKELIASLGLGSGQTAPSSTRKKLVKEGNPKYQGKRSLESEIREDAATRFRESFGPGRGTNTPTSAYVMRNVGGKGSLPRISGPKPKKKKSPSGISPPAQRLIQLKKLAQLGQLPPEIARMLRDVPGI